MTMIGWFIAGMITGAGLVILALFWEIASLEVEIEKWMKR